MSSSPAAQSQHVSVYLSSCKASIRGTHAHTHTEQIALTSIKTSPFPPSLPHAQPTPCPTCSAIWRNVESKI